METPLDNDHKDADPLGIAQLERRIEDLIRLCQQLRHENHRLRAQYSLLLAERAELIGKNEVARSRVESIISRLREMEGESRE